MSAQSVSGDTGVDSVVEIFVIETKQKSQVKSKHLDVFHAFRIHPIGDFSSQISESVSIAMNAPIPIDAGLAGSAVEHRFVPEAVESDIGLTHGRRAVDEWLALVHSQASHAAHGLRARATAYQAIV